MNVYFPFKTSRSVDILIYFDLEFGVEAEHLRLACKRGGAHSVILAPDAPSPRAALVMRLRLPKQKH